MIEIEKPRIERVEASDSYGKFVVEPLEHGFGQTLGNSLRRVLLSSLPGVAVSSIRIEGIQHEFSAVPGVKEDVAEIILNLKELSAKLYCDGPKTVSINVKGPCEMTAGGPSPWTIRSRWSTAIAYRPRSTRTPTSSCT